MGTDDEFDYEVDLANMPRGWVCFAIGEGQPIIAPPPVRERIIRLLELEKMWSEYVHAIGAQTEANERDRSSSI